MNTHRFPSPLRRRLAPAQECAFTLIELVVVITIMAILMVFSVPAINQAMGANRLTGEGNRIVQELAKAQGEAQRTNRPVQVRFYAYDDPSIPGSESLYRAMQVFRYAGSDLNVDRYTPENEDGSSLEPVDKLVKFQDPIIMTSNATYTSLMNAGEHQGTVNWGNNNTLQARFIAFDFLGNGSTNLSGELFAGRQYVFLTLVDEKHDPQTGGSPNNFVCIQIDRFNGSVRQYRP